MEKKSVMLILLLAALLALPGCTRGDMLTGSSAFVEREEQLPKVIAAEITSTAKVATSAANATTSTAKAAEQQPPANLLTTGIG